jgi:phage repressor protein C with HTH and peptisase S24 domain
MDMNIELDMRTVADRIQLRMTELGLQQVDVINQTGMSKGTVSKWLSGVNIPKSDSMSKLAKVLKTTPDWLLYESGLPSVAEQLQAKLDNSGAPLINSEIDPNSKIWVPLVDVRFSCGNGESVEFHYDETKKLLSFEPDFFQSRSIKPSNTRLMYAKGDSMEEYIYDGDVFAIDVSDTEIRDGGIYAVYFEGEAMLKQVFKESGGKLILHSKNPKYRDKEVSEINGSNFKVMGRQFWRAG